ncbi:MAG: carbonic anhydrase [Clostridiales bacterium]|nr:carbonic anhydrase [Clostridiales bacterium]
MKEKFEIANSALERLKEGNKLYINSEKCVGDVSQEKRRDTFTNGQHPYAVIVSCSDSRVIPESIFSAGIGDLFVIRVAGNVVDNVQLGSVEYAVEHLGCRLVVVLGHTGCGAVSAAMSDNCGFVKHITDEIKRAIGEETDTVKASVLNVKQSVYKVQTSLAKTEGLKVCGALYHTDSGVVNFDLNNCTHI